MMNAIADWMVIMTLKHRLRRMLAVLAACALLTGCSPPDTAPSATEAPTEAPVTEATAAPAQQSAIGFYFDTTVTITLYGAEDGLLEDIWAACARYEGLLSKTVEGSDVDRINRAGGQTVTVDPETYVILQEAKSISAAAGHAFSITIAPLTAMWDFTHGTCQMPTDEERLAALPLINDEALVLGENNTVTLPAGMGIDLGGIAKGYIADKVAELCRGRCYGAIINLGGNTYVLGKKPNGTPFRIGVQDPRQEGGRGNSIAVLSLEEGTVVTSGVYERFFEKDGVRYHHILDPQTGSSAVSDLLSATVITESSMRADALATACVVMGSEKALAFLTEQGVDGLLIKTDCTLVETEGLTSAYAMQVLQ